jgi:DNA repair protein RecO (recombination protein O)
MLIKTKAIVISAIKYQEKSLIVKCYTASDGIKSYFVHNAFSGKKSNQKIAYFQPLTILEIEANHKNKGSLESFKEIKLAIAYQSINTNIVKSTIAIFISEILHHSIHEEEKNEDLFSFLEAALLWLDHNDQTANFHLILLLEITKFFGFYPDISQNQWPYFEMSEGKFSKQTAMSCLSEAHTFLFKKLLDLKFDSPQKIFSVSQRQVLLTILLDYYGFHLEGFKKPKSVEVLKEVFA